MKVSDILEVSEKTRFSLDELLPMAHRYGYSHIVIFGIMLGLFIMALSLLIL